MMGLLGAIGLKGERGPSGPKGATGPPGTVIVFSIVTKCSSHPSPHMHFFFLN